jgi:hypothetical protein
MTAEYIKKMLVNREKESQFLPGRQKTAQKRLNLFELFRHFWSRQRSGFLGNFSSHKFASHKK